MIICPGSSVGQSENWKYAPVLARFPKPIVHNWIMQVRVLSGAP